MRAKCPSGGSSVLSDQYVAGLFDGEGCMFIHKVWLKGKYEKYSRIRMRIFITNTNLYIIKLLTEWLGGGGYDEKGSLKAGWKACYDWRLTGKKDMTNFLNRIKNYVVIKKEEVRLGLQFCETIGDSVSPPPLDKNQRGLREVTYQRLRLLQKEKLL